MNINGFKIIVLIGLLGLGLTACTPKTTPAPAHPEVGYEEDLVVMEVITTNLRTTK